MSKPDPEPSPDLEAMKRRNLELQNEAQTMKAKVICLETEKHDAYVQLKKYKEALIAHRSQLTGLQEHLYIKKDLETQIDNHKKQMAELQGDLDRMREQLKDTENDMRNYQKQYQDSMDLMEKLTSNNVDLKVKVTEFSAELDSLHSSHDVLLSDLDVSREALAKAQETVAGLSERLTVEQDTRKEETDLYRMNLEQKDAELLRLRKESEDNQNQARLTSRMYQATLKDLKRQLTAATKAQNGLENGKGDHDSSEQASLRSRASSSSSLELSPILLHTSASCHALSSKEESSIPSPQATDQIDRSVLIDKIVRLQRELARKDEKLDFLEDHIAMLTCELKKRPK